MFKVLGCFSADRAALNTVNRSYITKELSLFSQEDGNPICFFISIYVFDNTKYTNSTNPNTNYLPHCPDKKNNLPIKMPYTPIVPSSQILVRL